MNDAVRESSYEFVIKVAPVTKKNHQQIGYNRKTGSRYIMPSPQYQKYKVDCGWFLKAAQKKVGEPIAYPVNVKCMFYMPTQRRVDLNNLLEAATDVLVDYGILEDDNAKIVAGHDGSRVIFGDKEPRTEVYITPMEAVE